MAHQSLYRRFRPQRFSEVRGQDHLVRALRNAVADDRVGHAYLLSGPRGTGKTTTARILAKALNCTNVTDGEPCGECDSCVAIAEGSSFDVFELDAASNNGVDAIRELVDRASQASPGRTKVYILDEVHMLSTAASNALLKTLEEPPDHVVFVLATTDPQKVLSTIKSRTQHYEVHLISGEVLGDLVDDVAARAELDVGADARAWVLRAGGGSARDTLSALDRVVAFGGVPDEGDSTDALVEAVADQDTGRALLAVDEAVSRGRAPRTIGEDLLGRLRDVFLASLGAELGRLSPAEAETVGDQARRLGPRGATRALEVLGDAFVGIQDAPDPRVTLEVALVRMTRPELATGEAGLARRVEALEQALAEGGAPGRAATAPAGTGERPAPTASAAPADPAAAPTTSAGAGDAPAGSGAAEAARRVLAERRGSASGGRPSKSTPASSPPPSDEPAAGAGAAEAPRPAEPDPPTPSASATSPSASTVPSREELTLAWGDTVLDSLKQRAKARFGGGRFLDSDGGTAVFALPNDHHRRRCEEVKGEVEAALAEHFGRPVPLRVVVDDGATAPPAPWEGRPAPEPDDGASEVVDPDELVDAHDAPSEGVDLVRQAFPGTEEVAER